MEKLAELSLQFTSKNIHFGLLDPEIWAKHVCSHNKTCLAHISKFRNSKWTLKITIGCE